MEVPRKKFKLIVMLETTMRIVPGWFENLHDQSRIANAPRRVYPRAGVLSFLACRSELSYRPRRATQDIHERFR